MSEQVMATYSALESNRFGLRIYRGSLEAIDVPEILSFLFSEEVDIAILRIPSVNIGVLSKLNEAGIPYLVADTLVYYSCDLLCHEPKKIINHDLVFTETKNEHINKLDNLVKKIFIGYQNHYNANPFLNKKDILEGYQEWVRNYITDIHDGRISWIIKKNESPVGFIACSFANEKCEIVLNGVHPNASGQGIYSDLIRFTQKYFREKGFRTMKVSTQVHNYAVQKVWVREGFFVEKSYNTVHLNCFMNNAVLPVKKYRVKGAEIHDYLNVSFVKKIIRGFHAGSDDKHFFATHTLRYLENINDSGDYQVVISLPYRDVDRDYYKVLVKVINKDNSICIYAYYDLLGEQS